VVGDQAYRSQNRTRSGCSSFVDRTWFPSPARSSTSSVSPNDTFHCLSCVSPFPCCCGRRYVALPLPEILRSTGRARGNPLSVFDYLVFSLLHRRRVCSLKYLLVHTLPRQGRRPCGPELGGARFRSEEYRLVTGISSMAIWWRRGSMDIIADPWD